MSKVTKLNPPKRYLIESKFNADRQESYVLVDVTGQEDLVYTIGLDSPWVGLPLEKIEEFAKNHEYGVYSSEVLRQCRDIGA